MVTDITSLGELFHRSARLWPERPALQAEGSTLSYRALYQQAHRVRKAIPETETPQLVGVWTARRLADYQALLGIALAGHAYVPLNSDFPSVRNAFILDKARVELIFCDQADLDDVLATVAESGRDMDIVVLGDTVQPQKRGNASIRPLPTFEDTTIPAEWPGPRDPERPAYLLFTSGSTGEPKGVLIRQRNVLTYLQNIQRLFRFDCDDRFAHLFDLTFDLSVHDMFACWQVGACLYALTRQERLLPHRAVARHQLTVWFSVPTQASLLHRNGLLKPSSMPSLRLSLFCGEPLPSALAAAWYRAAPHSCIDNLYGPTEATIAISCHQCRPGNDDDPVSIGSLFPGHYYLLLDEQGEVTETDSTGELALAGPQVTDGYLHSPTMTRKSFFRAPDPDGSANRLWYRTGDRVRRSPNGELHFLGRCNRQVKINGYRVELGEIEATIRHFYPDSTVAVIFEHAASPGEGLTAYLDRSGTDTDALRRHCRARLPTYMVPNQFIILASMPTGPSGKLDYNALIRFRSNRAHSKTGAD